MKLSSVLTISTFAVEVLVISGCAQHRGQSAQVSHASSPSVNAPLVAPKDALAALPPSKPAVDPSVITDPPPPPQVEVVGAPPGPDFVWAPGHWEWDGSWSWTAGKWATVPSPRAAWIPGHWSRRHNGWVWVSGYWRVASLK